MRTLLALLPVLVTLSACNASAPFVAYQKADLPDAELSRVTITSNTSFETRFWTFKDPLVCNEPVVKTVEKGMADDRLYKGETVVRHGVRGEAFSFYVGVFDGGATAWREVRQVVTFVPREAAYRINIDTADKDGRLQRGGFTIFETTESGTRALSNDEFVVRKWRNAAMSGPGWALPLSESELELLKL